MVEDSVPEDIASPRQEPPQDFFQACSRYAETAALWEGAGAAEDAGKKWLLNLRMFDMLEFAVRELAACRDMDAYCGTLDVFETIMIKAKCGRAFALGFNRKLLYLTDAPAIVSGIRTNAAKSLQRPRDAA